MANKTPDQAREELKNLFREFPLETLEEFESFISKQSLTSFANNSLLPVQTIAKRLGMNRSTYNRRINNVSTWEINELKEFFKIVLNK